MIFEVAGFGMGWAHEVCFWHRLEMDSSSSGQCDRNTQPPLLNIAGMLMEFFCILEER